MEPAQQHFTESVDVYDIIYGELVDYDRHVTHVLELIAARCPDVRSVLEMGCGTGQFMHRLAPEVDVVGVDLSHEMLAVCRRKHPDLEVHHGDFATVDLGRRFGAVVCLFSSIGYVSGVAGLETAIENFVRHTAPEGVVVIDGWLRPESAVDGFYNQQSFERDGVLVTRSTLAFVRGAETEMLAGHLVNDGKHLRTFTERHLMGLFSDDQYLEAMESAGLSDLAVVEGFNLRGRFVGTRA